MKKLLLVRHGKAADESISGDFDRPLKKSGINDVEDLAKHLKHEGIIPQVIITSTALRAKTTAEIIADKLNITNILQEPQIYEAVDKTLLKVINAINDQYDFAMLAGHNPGFSSIATYLSGKYVNLHTSGAVLIEFNLTNWAEISGATGKIAWEAN